MDVILHGKINVEAVITLKTLKWEDYSGLSESALKLEPSFGIHGDWF